MSSESSLTEGVDVVVAVIEISIRPRRRPEGAVGALQGRHRSRSKRCRARTPDQGQSGLPLDLNHNATRWNVDNRVAPPIQNHGGFVSTQGNTPREATHCAA